MQWNCRGARNKLAEIQGIANNMQILCLQETLIISSSHFRVNGFNQINLYSSSPNIRGLSTLIHCDYDYASLDCSAFSHTSMEIIGTQIDCSLDEPLFIFNIYRHPNVNAPPHFYSKLFAFASTHKYVLFLGDSNAHHPDWEDHHSDSQGKCISQEIEAYQLVIMNDGQPTFLSSPNTATIIDLSIVTRSLAPLINLETYQDLHGSDHYPVRTSIRNTHPSTVSILIQAPLNPLSAFPHSRPSYTQGLPDESRSSLRDELFSQVSLSPVQKYEYFCKALNEIISLVSDSGKKYLPHKKRVTKTRIPAPWWNDRCARATELRSTMCRIYKAHPSWDNWIAYKRSNTQCQKTLRKEKRAGWHNLCASFNSKTSMSEIWRFVKSYKAKSLASEPANSDSKTIKTAHESAFSKLYPPSCLHLSYPSLETLLREDESSPSSNSWMDAPFSLQELDASIATCKVNSSPGLDQFDYRVAILPLDIRSILLDIYNELYENGQFPSSWHESLVVLVPKPGGNGFRPIALLSCFLKILERMIYRRLI